MANPTETWHLDTIHLGQRVLVFDRVNSTSNLAAMLANDPAHDGVVILANEQTAGRGQHGRSWACPPGVGVLMSVLLFPPPTLRRPALLTAWAAVAVCETIESLLATSRDRQGAEKSLPDGRGSSIKWPNDVLLDGRKICGILIETRNVEGQVAVIAGIGLNVNQSAEHLADLPDATSLRLSTGEPFDQPEVARALIRRLDADYDRLWLGDATTLESAWRNRLGLQGESVVAECIDGNHRGRLIAINWTGLELQTDDGRTLRLLPEMVRHLYLGGFSSSTPKR